MTFRNTGITKLIVYVLILVFVFSSGFVLGQYETARKVSSGDSGFIDQVMNYFVGPGLSSEDWKLLDSIRDIIEKHYYRPESVTATLLNIGAAHGMVDALPDPYSAYLDPKEYEEFLASASGNYSGIGVLVKETKNREGILIVKVFPETPSEKAGLQSGDIIIRVDGEDIRGLPIEVVTSKIKGPPGTTVNLTVLREEETIDFTLQRSTISIPAVLDDKIISISSHKVAYIDFSTMFFRGSAEQVAQVIEKYLQQGVDAIILDVRNNPGGLVSEVVDLLGYFVPNEHVLTIAKRDGTEKLSAEKHGWIISIPVVVLVNEFSASATEIFAANLKYYKKAVIIGTKTFGKGTVQDILPLGNAGAVKLTIAEYITAGDYKVEGHGVEPDIEVDYQQQLSGDVDVILDAAKDYLREILGD